MSKSRDTNRNIINNRIDISISGNSVKQMAYRQSSKPLSMPETGVSAFPVIMLHGWLDNLESFTPLLESEAFQSSSREFVAIDFPGHGESFTRPAGENLNFIDNVADIIAFTLAMGWQKFYIVGHSMGAALGSLITATYPEKVLGFVSIEAMGPMAGEAEDAVKQLREHLNYRLKKSNATPKYNTIEAALTARMRKGGADKKSMRAMVKRNLVAVDDGFKWKTDQRLRHPTAVRMTEQHTIEVLRSMRCKMLAIWGDQGFRKMYPEISKRGDQFHHLTQIELPGEHHLHMQSPDLVAPEILKFLDQCDLEMAANTDSKTIAD